MLNRMMQTQTTIDPFQFSRVMKLVQSPFSVPDMDLIIDLSKELELMCTSVDQEVDALGRASDAFLAEADRLTKRRKSLFEDPTDNNRFDETFSELKHTVGDSFLPIIFAVMKGIKSLFHHLRTVSNDMKPAHILSFGDGPTIPQTMADLTELSIQIQMNESTVGRFITGINAAEMARNDTVRFAKSLVSLLDAYYAALLKRHSTDGVEVHGSPVSTDIAMTVFENVDANGEIQDGKKPDEISAYSIRKAVIVVEAVRVGIIGDFIRQPQRLIEFLQGHLKTAWALAGRLHSIAVPVADKVRSLLGRSWQKPPVMSDSAFDQAVSAIMTLDPNSISFKEKSSLMTAAERRELAFRNETIKGIERRLAASIGEEDTESVIRYVLDRKHELRTYHLEENSFFVCKIGGGNPFTGEAPGQLEVVPGVKPTVTLSDVHGSGFDEVKEFINQVTSGPKWFDLFVATSPSKKADKSNVLLVGPQGSGKTEVLRAVASDRGCIGIFAQASDFLTCWKGEAEKNPKRLFEGGLKIQKESGKQVFFLIDEIDTILNSNQGQNAFGGINLATEFQILMDGIMSYPSIALWGATNHPERIPMPLIRRFAKVVIVGELDQAARVRLLKQFASHMPIAPDFPEQAWEDAAQKLEGAVGDVIRKTVDQLWRSKMTGFITRSPEKAQEMVKFLNEGGKFDVGTFTPKRRQEFQDLLQPHVQVEPKDLMDSVDSHLSNFAIQAEIQKCVDTYEGARQFLAGLKNT